MKKIAVIMLSFVMIFSLCVPTWAEEQNGNIESGGTWGGIDWTLTTDGTLTIAPTVNEITKIKPYSDTNELYQVGEVPAAVNDAISAITGWPFDRNAVKTLVIKEGVTSIGSFALQGLTNLTGEVVIPSTVTYIGQETFQKSYMTKLTFADGGSGELCIGPGAFKQLKITELTLPEDRPVHLHCWVFNNNPELKDATLPATITAFSGWTHAEYEGMDWVYGKYAGSNDIFSGCGKLESLTFGSEEVQQMFNAADGNANTINNLGVNPVIEYTVLFNVNGHGTAPDSQSTSPGGTITEPCAPAEDGFTFGGWYTDAACTTAFNFTSNITSPTTTLYAKWTEKVNTPPTSAPTPPTYYPPVVDTTTEPEVISPQTFDGGIALAVSTSILSVPGSALLLRKRED